MPSRPEHGLKAGLAPFAGPETVPAGGRGAGCLLAAWFIR